MPTRALKNQTPYECLKGRKPSIVHVRVFGCIANAKVDSALLKKLDDHSQTLVHVGIEPGSKAYRFYNPNSKRIVVSRDVIFDEQACWNWKGADKHEQFNSGMFRMTWGSTLNEGNEPFVIGMHQGENTTDETKHLDANSESTHTEEESEQAATHGSRRSSRQTSKPSYLDDYILLSEIECE